MTTKKLNKLFITALSLALLFSLPLFAEILTDQTLKDDLNYYRKTSAQNKLTPNDRSYILNRIKEKYQGSGLDTSPLDREIKNTSQDTGSSAPEAPVEAAGEKHAGDAAPAGAGRVEKIFVSETSSESKIMISVTGASRSNYFLMKDPSSGEPARIVVDFYGVKDKLSAAARNISPKQGLFSGVSSEQLEGPPNNVVRVTAQLRQDVPYSVKKEGNVYIVSATKSVPDSTAPEAAPAQVTAPPPSTLPLVSMTAPARVPAAAGLSSSTVPAPQEDPAPDVKAAAPSSVDKSATPPRDDYLIDNGDILGVAIYPADELSREVIVQPDGNIPFPLIGTAQAKGLTAKQLEGNLSRALGRYITAPQVTVTLKQFSKKQIFITGEVKTVGAFNFRENLRLLEFISSVGGFTDAANRKEVKIYRGPPTKRQTHVVDIEELIKSGDFSKDFLLEPGDIIEVQKGAAKVAVLGDIHTPGYYDYKENMHLVELISLAGGFTDSGKINDISIIHQISSGKQSVDKVNLNKILSGKQQDVAIQSGDTVFVPKGRFATANWFLTNIMPWLSLLSVLVVLRLGL